MYYVGFANSRFEHWREGFRTYTEAWITKVKEIEEMFGPAVAALVGAVTNEKGDNRKVRAALTYPKIRQAGALAVRLKLADRVANVESGGYLVKMYAREHEDFRRALYTVGESEDLWARLADLFAQARETAGESLAQAFKDRKTS